MIADQLLTRLGVWLRQQGTWAGRQLLAGLRWWAAQPHHVPASLMLVGAWGTFYAYEFGPPALRAEIWNLGGAFGRLLLVVLVVLRYRSAPITAAALWWGFEDVQVIVCGVWWMVAPWPLELGQNQCEALTGVPLSLAGVSLGAVLAWVVHRATFEGDAR